MTFPVTVPNTFATLAGNQQAALLDQNFAALVAGFTNTLNADNTQGPSAPLSWTQPLTLAPSSGVALTLTGVSGQDTLDINLTAAAGVGWGINMTGTINTDVRGIQIINTNAGTAAGTVALAVGNSGSDEMLLGITGANFSGAKFTGGPAGEVGYVWGGNGMHLVLATGAGGSPRAGLYITGTTGQVVVPAPTAGAAFTVLPLAAAIGINVKADDAVIQITNGANTAVGQLTTVKGWVGSGSVTDAALGSFANLNFYSGATSTLKGQLASAGNWTFNAPTSGNTVTINGLSTGTPLIVAPAAGGSTAIGLGNATVAAVAFSVGTNYSTTGSSTPTIGANKPGANNSVIAWLSVLISGVQGWIPVLGN